MTNNENEDKIKLTKEQWEAKNFFDDSRTTNVDNIKPLSKKKLKMEIYEKRINYGKLINSGLVSDKLAFKPVVEKVNKNLLNDIIGYKFINTINNNCKGNNPNNLEENKNTSNTDDEESKLFNLIYDSELNTEPRMSKREIKLRKKLEEKILELKKLNMMYNNFISNNKNV